MLADSTTRSAGVGALAPGLFAPGTFVAQVVEFIATHLSRWRDHPDRRAVQSERELTDQLSSYLNSAARSSLDAIQFSTEVPDSGRRGRTVDMAIRPIGAPIVVMGRRYTLFDVLLPIECKRLPTPAGRDEREYVVSGDEARSGGGIQRFKLGAHGSTHSMAVMIGYIQDGQAEQWLTRVNHWIAELEAVDPTWSAERLALLTIDEAGVSQLRSLHRRPVRDGANIELRHLWVVLGS